MYFVAELNPFRFYLNKPYLFEMTFPEFEKRYTYSQKDLLGSGGFADVFKARDNQTGYFVAVKVSKVKPEFGNFTLQNEVELAKKIPTHPNIAHYERCHRFDMGIMGTYDFAVLKYYELGNLDVFLQKRDLTDSDIREILRGILHGLQLLHGKGVVHRDLKASNILMDRENGIWMPKIADFGLSGAIHDEHSVTNDAVGLSYYYAAPEQIRGEKILKNVDFWAFGVLTYRLFLKEMPFQGQTGADKLSLNVQIGRQITEMALPEKAKTFPAPYKEILDLCWVEDKSKRVQEASILLKLLESDDYQPVIIPIVRPIAVPTAVPTTVSAAFAWKKPALIAGSCALLIGGWLMFRPSKPTIETSTPNQIISDLNTSNPNPIANPTSGSTSTTPSAASATTTTAPNNAAMPAGKPSSASKPPSAPNGNKPNEIPNRNQPTDAPIGTFSPTAPVSVKTTEPPKLQQPTTEPPKSSPVEPPKEKKDADVFYFAERMPAFAKKNSEKELAEYLKKNINSSKVAHKQGKVTVGFIVMADGSIDKVTVEKGFDADCDAEALRVVRAMPKWEPGFQNGQNVKVKFSLPIHFKE